MEVNIRKSALKDLKSIDKQWALKIIDFLENIQENDILNATKLKGINKDLYRIRLGDYRIIFDNDYPLSINILRILHRQSAYNKINKL